ncbi:MAG: single-stranded-DNA-specific exonuclease RecJ [Oscillospiraceae bacterium]|nr:single-stranded-DNA-specific exonuclease RecJ [Oscillospiraceae bacterium]
MKVQDWKIPYAQPEIPEALCAAGYAPLLAAMLHVRGIDTPEQARAFLHGDESQLHDPMLLKGMDRAVERLRRAIETGEAVAVFGDYDVDGITSTCVLTDYLRSRGLQVRAYIPDRISEGYGLNPEAVRRLHAHGVTLIVSVDCGITAIEETALANTLGMDVIITDHHECGGGIVPDAAAVVDPKQPACTYPNPGLAGVGVAFKLLCAIEGGSTEMLRRYADLVAIGTVADVMPLEGENRFLVAEGLRRINTDPRPGIRALLEESGAGERTVTATTIGFTLAPRINAAGRLGETAIAAKLLLTEDPGDAMFYARSLCDLNRRRQALEQQIWDEASERAGVFDLTQPLVLDSDEWHQGVIGIAASRLSEAFHLPTVMIRFDGDRGKGSCRSFGGFNLYQALSACSDLLEGFGGHALAAGLTIRRENIAAFRTAFAAYYRENPATELPTLSCDLRISDPGLLSMDNVAALQLLEPCGTANPRPLLAITAARLQSVTPIGGGKHLRLTLLKAGQLFDCVFFSCTLDALTVRPGDWVDAAFCPQINEFRGRSSVQLLISDIRRSDTPRLCAAILNKEPTAEWDRVDLCPARQDFVKVYKSLRGGVSGTPETLARALPPTLHPATACICLRVLEELGLIRYSFEGETLTASPVDGCAKKDLKTSALLLRLYRERRDLGLE